MTQRLLGVIAAACVAAACSGASDDRSSNVSSPRDDAARQRTQDALSGPRPTSSTDRVGDALRNGRAPADPSRPLQSPRANRPRPTPPVSETITGVVTRLDAEGPSLSIKDAAGQPHSWSLSFGQRSTIQNLKIGDRVDVTLTAGRVTNVTKK